MPCSRPSTPGWPSWRPASRSDGPGWAVRVSGPRAARRPRGSAPSAAQRSPRLSAPRGSADPARPELHADPRAGGPGRLGHRVLPGALAAAAHHQQVAVAQLVPTPGRRPAAAAAGPAARRGTRSRPPCPRWRPGRSGHRARRHCPGRPGTGTGPPCRTAPPGLPRSAGRAPRAPRQRGVGQVRTLAVEAEQPGHLDHPVIHPAPFLAPRHGVAQPFEQDVGARHPAGPDVHPRAAIEHGPVHRRAERPRSRSSHRSSRDPCRAVSIPPAYARNQIPVRPAPAAAAGNRPALEVRRYQKLVRYEIAWPAAPGRPRALECAAWQAES